MTARLDIHQHLWPEPLLGRTATKIAA